MYLCSIGSSGAPGGGSGGPGGGPGGPGGGPGGPGVVLEGREVVLEILVVVSMDTLTILEVVHDPRARPRASYF